ncbi:DNA/RNA non-specific endonuclease [Streptomyces sp. NPDC093105]|uniref:DNA/RNA non-specific endonuclease n=1 Tax=Streptomyces sp. NPDC093105 TaxID=3366029 RepID=UPI003828C275
MKEVPEKKPSADRPTGPTSSRSGGLSPHSVQRLQGAVGNAAVARLVAQRYTAPVKTPPNAAPGFRRVGADVAAKKRTMAAHAPAAAESKAAQDAAVAPPDDKEAQGKAANAEKMNAAKPGEFDKAAFVAAVDKAIEAQAPKNLDEADKFSKSGRADRVKEEVDGKVGEGKDTSAKDIETATKAPPDTSAAKDKPVTPLAPDRPPADPGAPSATDAIPEKQPPAVTDFSQGPAENDKAMADAEVTEEQLAKGNEPEFDEALKAKKTAETDSAKAPGKAHTAEDQQLATAKAGAAAAGAQAMNTLTATRAAAGKAVDGGKSETKSKDEQKRAEVTAKLQKVFDATKKDVEATLTGLDQKVDTAFTSGEKAARDAFTADHKARMKKYKDKRYGGLLGKGRWLKDKFAGMPQEANDLYQESRKLYVARMRTVISQVADLIGVELGRAKARIAQGRTDLKAEVDRLPADLRAFGEEAQQDFAGKFEDLEASVDEKSEQLVQDLANKYTAALNAVDEEIKKLQEANKGLIDKAKDAIAGVIKTINELKNLLLGILAKAASAIMKIIKDPIGFLGNLVKAVGAGLNLFVSNIGEHLTKGLVSWLLGTATKAGLELPDRFDLRGIIQLITGLLGLTWDNIRSRITRKGVPEEALGAVETSVPVAKKLATEGPAGACEEIKAETGDLKSTILSKLTEYLIPTVIIAGITWIVSLLNPASAFVRAVKGIIDIVTFVVNQGAQIADFVNAVLDAVKEIANGGAAGVPKMVETALAASIPLLIGFLAALLGIGGLANKVKSVFQAVSRPVNRAIDKIVEFIVKAARKFKVNPKEKDEKREGAGDEKKTGQGGSKVVDCPTRIGAESHTLRLRITGKNVSLLMASGPFDDVQIKVGVLRKLAAREKAAVDPGRQQYGKDLDEALDDVETAGRKLMDRTLAMPPSPARDRMMVSGLHGLSEMISDIGVRFRLPGLDFRRPKHNLVPSSVDGYGRALAYSGDPLSLESKEKGSASSGLYIPGIDLNGVDPLQRGHLVADLLGGPGNDARNLSTMTRTSNTAMKKPERAVADFIYKGDVSNQVTYEVRIEHQYSDASDFQDWIESKFPNADHGAGESLFRTTMNRHPTPRDITSALGGRALTQAQRDSILLALRHYLITSRIVFSITVFAGPTNTQPTPTGSPISNVIPSP